MLGVALIKKVDFLKSSYLRYLYKNQSVATRISEQEIYSIVVLIVKSFAEAGEVGLSFSNVRNLRIPALSA